MRLLLDEPLQPLSIHRVARVLGVTPMALYRHIADKDALLHAVAARLFSELEPAPATEHWSEQLRIWARRLRRHFLKYPMLLSLLGWRHHIASAWLGQLALLTQILARAGLRDAELASAVRWVSNTVMGAIFMEVASRHTGAGINPDDLRELSGEGAETLRHLLPYLLHKRAEVHFDDDLEWMLESLQARVRGVDRDKPD